MLIVIASIDFVKDYHEGCFSGKILTIRLYLISDCQVTYSVLEANISLSLQFTTHILDKCNVISLNILLSGLYSSVCILVWSRYDY